MIAVLFRHEKVRNYSIVDSYLDACERVVDIVQYGPLDLSIAVFRGRLSSGTTARCTFE